MGSGGEAKGHDCPLPSHPHILEAVSAQTKGDSELPPGSALTLERSRASGSDS